VRLEPPPQFFELICDESWSDEQIEAGLREKYPDYTGDPRDQVIIWSIVSPCAIPAPSQLSRNG
jgi:hypothetical protein